MSLCMICKKETDQSNMVADKHRPGNVGTLCIDCRKTIKRSTCFRSDLYARTLNRLILEGKLNSSLKECMHAIERAILIETKRVSKNISEMALILDVNRTTLSSKMNVYQIKEFSDPYPVSMTCSEQIAHPTGLSWIANQDKWLVRIIINGDRVDLGLFRNKKYAEEVYSIAKKSKGYYTGNKTDFCEHVSYLVEAYHER